jgi:hypothetical protein
MNVRIKMDIRKMWEDLYKIETKLEVFRKNQYHNLNSYGNRYIADAIENLSKLQDSIGWTDKEMEQEAGKMRTSNNVLDKNQNVFNGFDYDLQTWVVGGIIQDCGHPKQMACGCNGRKHEGQSVENVKNREV